MKKKLLYLLLVIASLQISVPSFADTLDDLRRIKIRAKIRIQSRSVSVIPDAYIEGKLLTINFSSVASSATVTVKNAETGEVVYSFEYSDVDACTIDLSTEDAGKYTLDIELPTSTFTGEFEL